MMIEINIADALDVDDLSYIETSCFSAPWSKNSIEEALNDSNYLFIKLVCDGKTIGYGGLMTVLDESDIVNIAVLSEHRGKGYGKMLLARLESEAKKRKSVLLHLEVRQGNRVAIGLYEGFGFEIDGLRKNYYKKPQEDAVLMTKKI